MSVGSVAVEGTVAGDLAELTVTFGVVAGRRRARSGSRSGSTARRSPAAREGDRDLALAGGRGGGLAGRAVGQGEPRRPASACPCRCGSRPRAGGSNWRSPRRPRPGSRSSSPGGSSTPRRRPASRSRCEAVEGRRLDPALGRPDAPGAARPDLAGRRRDRRPAPAAPRRRRGRSPSQVDPGSFRTRSSWSIRSARGTARTFRSSSTRRDELVDLEVDGQPPAAGTETVGGATPADGPAGRAARARAGAPAGA